MVRQGVSQARISLDPQELGGVRVILTQTDNGLIARVVADHPEATQALVQTADELRQRLQANGTTLLRLDIGNSGQQSAGNTGSQQQQGQAQPGATADGDPSSSQSTDLEPATGEPTNETQLTVQLGDGSLIDVMA
jgi:flagellar hook-length control protein FliK